MGKWVVKCVGVQNCVKIQILGKLCPRICITLFLNNKNYEPNKYYRKQNAQIVEQTMSNWFIYSSYDPSRTEGSRRVSVNLIWRQYC